jgi:hypothetical protein
MDKALERKGNLTIVTFGHPWEKHLKLIFNLDL